MYASRPPATVVHSRARHRETTLARSVESRRERAVTIGHPRGRAFRGTHGDGTLRDYGVATNDDWPLGDNEASGYGYRGGGSYERERERTRDWTVRELNPYSPVEWRNYGSWGGGPRGVAYGFRAVRTADPTR